MADAIQVSALLGVAVGALASYGTSAALERTRWRRAKANRWDERTVAAYTDYLLAVKDVVNLTIRMAASHGLDQHSAPLSTNDEDASTRMLAADAQRSVTVETVRLLARRQTMVLVLRMNEQLQTLANLARDSSARNPEVWRSIYGQFEATREFFVISVRRDLGIIAGSSLQSPSA